MSKLPGKPNCGQTDSHTHGQIDCQTTVIEAAYALQVNNIKQINRTTKALPPYNKLLASFIKIRKCFKQQVCLFSLIVILSKLNHRS